MIPTPPDEADHPHPSFNPKVPGSRPGRPTKPLRQLVLVGPNGRASTNSKKKSADTRNLVYTKPGAIQSGGVVRDWWMNSLDGGVAQW
jgi:hypothetical protein